MSDYKPLYFAVGIFLIVGLIIPQLAYAVNFNDNQEYESVSSINEFFAEGISIFGFQINIFGFLPDAVISFLTGLLIAFNLLPSWIVFILIIYILLGIIVTVIKLLPTT